MILTIKHFHSIAINMELSVRKYALKNCLLKYIISIYMYIYMKKVYFILFNVKLKSYILDIKSDYETKVAIVRHKVKITR